MADPLCRGSAERRTCSTFAGVTEAQQYDVVVVGSGGGAMTGAFLAQKAGLSTVVVEKTALLGGTSAYSGGACWLPGQRRCSSAPGIADSTERRATYLAAILESTPDAGEGRGVPAARPRAGRRAGGRRRRSTSSGCRSRSTTTPPAGCRSGRSIQPTNVKRGELPPEVAELVRPPVERDRAGEGGRNTLSGGQSLIARLLDGFLRDGGTVLTELPVTGLVLDGDRVAGVAAMTPEGPVEIRARRAACWSPPAGSRATPRCATEHGVPGDVAWTMAPRGTNTGEPIEAAVAIGAATDYRGVGWFCPGLEQPDGGGSFTLGFRSGLMVDANGERYANECAALRPVRPGDGQGARSGSRRGSSSTPARAAGCPRSRCPRATRPRTSPPAPGCGPTRSRELAGLIGVPADALAGDRRAVQRLLRDRRRRGLRPRRRRVRHVLRRRHRPEQGAHPVRPGAVLRRPLRALRPRHQGRPGHRRRRPGAARGRHRDRRAVRRQQHAPPRSSARSTPARAPRSARRWCSRRWRCATSWADQLSEPSGWPPRRQAGRQLAGRRQHRGPSSGPCMRMISRAIWAGRRGGPRRSRPAPPAAVAEGAADDERGHRRRRQGDDVRRGGRATGSGGRRRWRRRLGGGSVGGGRRGLELALRSGCRSWPRTLDARLCGSCGQPVSRS